MKAKFNDYKNLLKIIGFLDNYKSYVKENEKKDSLKNIKIYFETNIFISIVDFNNEDYNVFTNKRKFINYLEKNPNKIFKKKYAKEQINQKILLRKVF